ncbi:hypothetical protein [Pseudomonas benzenivorans]|uniref:hypothetical protein n=1 Tax=Pseudomonas benzenivorans TaxID=556533 RepID=UPI0035171590
MGTLDILLSLCLAMDLAYRGFDVLILAPLLVLLAVLLREAGIPRHLLPGAIALGAFTFTMAALPGTPAILSAIPSPFFGTDAFTAPILGLIGGSIMLLLGETRDEMGEVTGAAAAVRPQDRASLGSRGFVGKDFGPSRTNRSLWLHDCFAPSGTLCAGLSPLEANSWPRVF